MTFLFPRLKIPFIFICTNIQNLSWALFAADPALYGTESAIPTQSLILAALNYCPMEQRYYPLLILFLSLVSLLPLPVVRAGDAEALLSLKSTIDPKNSLPWRQGSNVCDWEGVKQCTKGRVTKLVLEYLNLTGSLDRKILNELDQLRVLSFKGNSISGQIPDLSGLVNLKSLFLNDNNFSGVFPASISSLHRLKVVVLAGNHISGLIPSSLLNLRRLYVLYLQDNQFSGTIPPLNQTSLRFFNVSNNHLSGEIPMTPALIQFNASSFFGNINLCGLQIHNKCENGIAFPPSLGPTSQTDGGGESKSKSNRSKLIKIIAASVGGFVVVLILLLLLFLLCRNRSHRKEAESRSKGAVHGVEATERGGGEGPSGSGRGGNNGGKQGAFSWEGDGLGSLVFCGPGDQQMSYSLEDLLKASAETLGRGSMGSTYKAVMESGFIVTVKRLKDARYPRLDEFRRHMDLLGKLRHPHLVPLRAYFQAKEERLLVYDYFPNGSLFSLIHGMSFILIYPLTCLLISSLISEHE